MHLKASCDHLQCFYPLGSSLPWADLLLSSKPVSWLFQKAMSVSFLAGFIDPLAVHCEEAIASHKEALDADAEPLDLIDHYLGRIEKESSESDSPSGFAGSDGHKNLLQVTSELFAVGGATISTALHWALLYVVLRPDVQARAREELDRVTGMKRPPSLEDR